MLGNSSKNVNKSLILALICLLAVVSESAIDMYMPVFNLMAIDMGIDVSYIQMTLSSYLFGMALSPIIVGYLSDKFGRKIITLVLLFIYCVFTTLIIFSTDIYTFIAFRFVTGFCAAFATVIAMTLLTDVFQGKFLAMAFTVATLAWACIPTFSPVIGAYITYATSYKFIFIAIIILGVLAFLLYLFFIPETIENKKTSDTNLIEIFRETFKVKSFRVGAYISSIIYGLYMSYVIVSPIIYKKLYSLNYIEIGHIQLIYGSAYLIGTILNFILLKRATVRDSNRLGVIFISLGITLLMLVTIIKHDSYLFFLIPMSIIELSTGLLFPNFCSYSLSEIKSNIGTASSILTTMQFGACSILTIFCLFIVDESLAIFSLFNLILILTILAVIFLSMQRNKT
jgi:DHA1 family bicyclomycin/chloramphenicol resistance-like MFS transporter